MRKLLAITAAALLTGLGITRAADVTVDLFYRALEPQGEWFETSDYGYVWHPRDVAANWRPYTVGNWAYTDAGWTWISDEPFGWATYHYGRWVDVEGTGWAWVPDTEWGPAWVSWRRSPKYVGWAPLPPEARFQADVGIKTWSDSYYDIGPANYSFVEVRHFGAPRLISVVVPVQENVTVLRETRNITNITVVNNVVYNGGPEYDVVVRESAEPVRRLRLERRTDVAFDGRTVQQDAFRTHVSGDTVQIVAPQVRYVPTAAPAKVEKKIDKLQVDRGWAAVKDRGQAEQLRAQLKTESPKPPAGLPPQPKFERLADRAPAKAAPGSATAQQPGAGQQPGAAQQPATEQQRATAAGGKQQTRGERSGKEGTAAAPGATVGTPSAEGAPAAATAQPGQAKTGADGEKGKGKRKGERQPAEQPTTGQPPVSTAPGLTTQPEGQPGTAGENATSPGKKQKGERGAAEVKQAPETEAATPAEHKKEKGKQRGDKKGEAPEAVTKPEATTSEASTETTESPAKAGKNTPPGRVGARGDRPERAERPEAPAARPERPERAERPDRPERPETGASRPEHLDQPQAEERPGRGAREKGGAGRPEVATERPGAPAAAAGQEERAKPGKKGGKGERKGGEREEGAGAEPKQ